MTIDWKKKCKKCKRKWPKACDKTCKVFVEYVKFMDGKRVTNK